MSKSRDARAKLLFVNINISFFAVLHVVAVAVVVGDGGDGGGVTDSRFE